MARGKYDPSVEKREQRTQKLLADLQAESNGQARNRLVEELVNLNLPLCEALANRYAERRAERDDLVQAARVGLVLAIRRYRPERGEGFARFAVPTIVGELKRHFRNHGWGIRPPRSIQELRPIVLRSQAELSQRSGREPTRRELADHLDVDPATVSDCLSAGEQLISLDAPVGPTTAATIIDLVSHNRDTTDVSDERLDLRRAVSQLSPTEGRVVSLRFVDDLTQGQISGLLGISQMQVSRVLGRALKRLRSVLASESCAA